MGGEELEFTWDGLPIAEEDPRGVTVVVHRRTAAGVEVLLLHRAHRGRDYAGDWAWTPPSGCRAPGEPVQDAARRELAEEAGLADVSVTPLQILRPASLEDGTRYHWALFAAEVSEQLEVRLVDPEHDRFVWVTPDRAAAMVKPHAVADCIAEALQARTAPDG